MKYLLLFSLPVFLACRKNTASTKCYECEMKYADGTPAARQFPCTDNLSKWQSEVKDNQGRAMTSTCKEL